MAIARAVSCGEDIGDDHLAGEVVEYVQKARRWQERDARFMWVLVVFALLTVALAIVLSIAGETRQALVIWAVSVGWVATIGWRIPRVRRRSIANAERAESFARLRLDPPRQPT